MRHFAVWAPFAQERVDLVADGDRTPMVLVADEGPDNGLWVIDADVPAEVRYGYSLDGGSVLPDPRGIHLPDGPHGLNETYDLDAFEWSDQGWQGARLHGSVLYELHIGTFTSGRTFDAAIERLDHLVDLGVTMVEMMPIAAFPGTNGWGYDGVAPYAVHEPYGGPAGFQRFVDACHAKGLAVCLDVVYNHLGPDGNYLGAYGPYFTDAYDTPWGLALNLDGPGSDQVRRYVLDNVRMWLRDFHVDALRLDAVHELYDGRALTLLEEIAVLSDELSEELGRTVVVTAESDRNDPQTVMARDLGGVGLAGQWADDVHHGLHVALTGEAQGYYGDFNDPAALETILRTPFFHAGTWSTHRDRVHGRPVEPDKVRGSQFVVSLQNHDQIGNRATGDRQSASLSLARLQAGAMLLLTSPFTPMLFMGEEWGASTPWQYFTDHTDEALGEAVRQGRRNEFSAFGFAWDDVPDPQSGSTVEASTLDWAELEEGVHAALYEWYVRLLTFRRERPELADDDLAAVVVRQPEPWCVVVHRGPYRVCVNLAQDSVLVDLYGETNLEILLSNCDASLGDDGRMELPADGAVLLGPTPD